MARAGCSIGDRARASRSASSTAGCPGAPRTTGSVTRTCGWRPASSASGRAGCGWTGCRRSTWCGRSSHGCSGWPSCGSRWPAASSSEAPLAYLSEEDAQRLRAELLARAAGLHHETPEAPRRCCSRCRSAGWSRPPCARSAVIGAVIVARRLSSCVAIVARRVVAARRSRCRSAWRRTRRRCAVVAHFGFTVAESPDGLRLRHGLLETRSQTVPPGRVQAVRIVEPLAVAFAGLVSGSRSTSPGTSARARAAPSVLCPVAPRAEALAGARAGAARGRRRRGAADRRTGGGPGGWTRSAWRQLGVGADEPGAGQPHRPVHPSRPTWCCTRRCRASG